MERIHLLKKLVHSGQQEALQFSHTGLQIEIKREALDLVTQADRSIEASWRQEIIKAFPYDEILGEEAGGALGGWMLDPIDGTTNYACGMPLWCCVASYRDPDNADNDCAAVCTADGTMVTASRSQGILVNGYAPARNKVTSLSDARTMSFYGWIDGGRQTARYDRVSHACRYNQTLHSGTLAGAWTAAGFADAFLFMVSDEARENVPWDIFPTLILGRFAGLSVIETSAGLAICQPVLKEAVQSLLL